MVLINETRGLSTGVVKALCKCCSTIVIQGVGLTQINVIEFSGVLKLLMTKLWTKAVKFMGLRCCKER